MKYIKLLRIKHYFKNILVFLPLVFSFSLFDKDTFMCAFWGFLSFSLVSSIVYIINDLRDIEKDRKHPIKKNRPLASGAIKPNEAIVVAVVLVFVIVTILFKNNSLLSTSTLILLIYLFTNIAYSFGLKDIPIIDITLLASGFVLRVLYGGFITNIEVSSWLFLTILSISFYMALGKRRNEIIKTSSNETRTVLKFYNKEYLDKMMNIFMTLSIVFYSLWSVIAVNNTMISYSVVFVIVLLLKYSLNIETSGFGDPIEVILTDKSILLIGLVYGIYILMSLYYFN